MTTALYRRYRPETFSEVIGQEHVTGPLMQALRSGRVNHAYLFSGPRGCGKTTSARILARTLNCARNTPETPIDIPCGECPSCVELARGGPGSLDVVEIDAASHNGVDDARDLRERATFAPARDRYKIFILDEAHMVTPQGFNALLKIVEEPPAHVIFVFATTEPDKVIGTIRSRTHHYPFRLVPPDVLGPYLEQLCVAEGITLGGGVVPLVTRAGGGSVRDSLSVLDQLIAGATEGVVDYDLAVGLLGFTHATLLDDVVDALAARDGGSIFRVVDHVVASGHEPRRFVEDLLERLRDLIVIAVSGEAADAVLRELPADQLERMRAQAQHLGLAELSRAADLANAALTEMTGATSPRLHLELLCARLLLPGADDGAAGLAARVERLERGGLAAGGPTAAGGSVAVAAARRVPVDDDEGGAAVPVAGGLSGAAAARAALQAIRRPAAGEAPAAGGASAAAPAAPATPAEPPQPASAPEPAAPQDRPQPMEPQAATSRPAAPTAAVPAADEPFADESAADEPAAGVPAAQDASDGVAEHEAENAADVAASDAVEPEGGPRAGAAADEPEQAPAAAPPTAAAEPAPAAAAAPATEAPAAGAPGGVTAEVVRRRWDEVVANLSSPVTRALVGPNAQVVALEAGVLRLGFASSALAQNFGQPRHLQAFEDAVYQTLGIQARIESVVDDGPRAREPQAETAPQPADAAGADDPDDPDDGWPDVPPPGAGRAPQDERPEPAPAAPAAPSPAGPVRAGSAPAGSAPAAPAAPRTSDGPARDARPPAPVPAGGASAQAPQAHGTSAVAVVERPVDVAVPPQEIPVSRITAPDAWPGDGGPGHAPDLPVTVQSVAVNEADAAWLAGVPLTERVPAGDPAIDRGAPAPAEPAPAPPVPARPAATTAAASAPAAAAPSAPPAAGAPTAPGALRRESPLEAAQRHALQARGTAPARPAPGGARPADSYYDDASADDPDITSTGLVGVPLVVRMLDGTVIEEKLDNE
ncbi:DNA polymerase III subunit gamma and tau [Puerhibacterium sp. TATVAM-FAB25]|uniref:DNA polymerase III subunit gamma and tau n=1 Tax=Puerhibacterium sp. TATVAM-FAB25 TaxID=3093699 RepID=UPI003978EDA1